MDQGGWFGWYEFKKKGVICKKIEKQEKGLKQLSDLHKRIVVEMVLPRPKKSHNEYRP